MKRLLSWILVLALAVTLIAGCTNDGDKNNDTSAGENTPSETANPLADAVAYVKAIYKTTEGSITGKDYQVIASVPVGDATYNITWTVDVAEDLVKIVVGDDGMVTIDINEKAETETPYVLTATIEGESLSWNHILPAALAEGMSYAEIVDMAYTLTDGQATDDSYYLYGTVTSIDTAWSDDYQNITVTIAVAGKEDKPIQCYRLSGEGAKDLAVGDDITVKGIIKNYKGLIEFDKGCELVGYGEHLDQSATLKAAFALAEGASMDYPTVLTGVISEIPTAWSDEYQNITVNLDFDGQTLQCYRLSGEGAKDLEVGDKITVAGIIKNYKGLIEFDKGCKLIPAELASSAKNAFSGYTIPEGESQDTQKTITGTISTIDTAWSADYKNITVTIVVGGLEDYNIMCYRLKGDGAEALAVGDTITVTGTLKNYKGTIEFDAGCTLDSVAKGEGAESEDVTEPAEAVTAPEDPAEIVAAAYALEAGSALPYTATLTGTILSIDTEYSEQYGNITVTIQVGDLAEQPIMCFRLKGEGAETLAVGNTITVTGTLKNYNGTIEFDAGCSLDAIQ